MVLVATPQVGEKEVSYSAITDWIALKLKQEFQVSVKQNDSLQDWQEDETESSGGVESRTIRNWSWSNLEVELIGKFFIHSLIFLSRNFQKILVFPNMDDLYIPLLNSEINNQNWWTQATAAEHSSAC